MYERLGDLNAYALVREHFALLDAVAHRHAGAIVKTIGDAVMAVFSRPADAVSAALHISAGDRALQPRAWRAGDHPQDRRPLRTVDRRDAQRQSRLFRPDRECCRPRAVACRMPARSASRKRSIPRPASRDLLAGRDVAASTRRCAAWKARRASIASPADSAPASRRVNNPMPACSGRQLLPKRRNDVLGEGLHLAPLVVERHEALVEEPAEPFELAARRGRWRGLEVAQDLVGRAGQRVA